MVARTLDARGPAPSRDPLARVVQRLGQAKVLLVLDGCEPVIEEAARVAAGVLAECPGVRVLATSREVLHLEGEVRLVVAPLAVLAAGADPRQLAASGRCGCSWSGRGQHGQGCRSPRTESRWRRRSAGGRTGCRWRSSSLPRASTSWGCARSLQPSRVAGRCLSRPETAGLSPSATCARSWPGAMTCWGLMRKALLYQLAVFRGGAPLSAVVATAARGQLGGQGDPAGRAG